MTSSNRPKALFSAFEFDLDRLSLSHGGEPVRVERKALEVLEALLLSAGQVVSSQEIIDRVWEENPHGVTPVHLAQCISKLRKAFAQFEPDTTFVETIRGSGYVFSHPVDQSIPEPVRAAHGPLVHRSGRSIFTGSAVAGLIAIVAFSGFTAWRMYPADDKLEIKRVLEESQKFEALVVYRDPENVDEDKINEYWITAGDYGPELDVRNLRAGVERLLRDNARYGPESRCEQFEIQDLELNADGSFATAKTLEKWFLAEYKTDGTLVRNKTIGPYFVHYILRKVDGLWKIEKSTTARANRPPPMLEMVSSLSAPSGGKEFNVRLSGQGFNPESVFVRIVGPGCPASSPCIVPNSALRLSSTISDSVIDNVPLTLASGEFNVSAQNGESVPSNSTILFVP